MQVWLDTRDLLPGMHWPDEIAGALEKSDAIILLLSEASVNKTGYSQYEVRHALRRTRGTAGEG
jgi:hypothetical protein